MGIAVDGEKILAIAKSVGASFKPALTDMYLLMVLGFSGVYRTFEMIYLVKVDIHE
jgi:hypothetical protein